VTSAVIFVQRGAPREKQRSACARYVLAQGWSVVAIVPHWHPDDAVQLARSGRVEEVVAAFDSRAVQQLVEDLAGAAEVIVVHPEPRVIEPPKHVAASIGELIIRLFRKGRTVKEIAGLVDGDTTDVRAILRKYGEDPGQKH